MGLDQSTQLLPREKLESRGPQGLTDSELLAILLRTGHSKKNVLQIAKDILKNYPLEKWSGLDLSKLTEVKGIGPVKAGILTAALELARRALKLEENNAHVVQKPQDVLPLVAFIRDSKKEHFICIFLNARKQVIHQETISIGTLEASLIHPREVFQPAIECSASSVIFVHNHPSGDATASREDILVTKRLCESGRLLGIDVLDHLIVSKNDYISLRSDNHRHEIGFLTDA